MRLREVVNKVPVAGTEWERDGGGRPYGSQKEALLLREPVVALAWEPVVALAWAMLGKPMVVLCRWGLVGGLSWEPAGLKR